MAGAETSHDSPIFIVGNDRSGTTMLRLMLDRDPALALPTESMIVSDFAAWRTGAVDLADHAESLRFVRRVWEHPKVRLWGLEGRPPVPPDGLGHAAAYRFALEAPYRAYAAAHGATRFGDKTSSYVHHIPEILAVWPTARVIVLVRDARDVGMSVQRLPFGANNALAAARQWAAGIRAGQAAAADHPDAVLHVRYEDLVSDPEAGMREICEFAGVVYDQDLLRIERSGADKVVATQQDWFTNLWDGINAKSVGKWRSGMSLADQRIYSAVAGAELEALGYEIPDEARADDVPAAQRARLEAHQAVTKIRNFLQLRVREERGREIGYVLRRRMGGRR